MCWRVKTDEDNMRITQEIISYLPELSDSQVRCRVDYCLAKGWALAIEYTDDPHPRTTNWVMFGASMFDLHDAAAIMRELEKCRIAYRGHYIRLTAFDSSHGVESLALAFIVDRPCDKPGFRLVRQEGRGADHALQPRRACSAGQAGRRALLMAGMIAGAMPQAADSLAARLLSAPRARATRHFMHHYHRRRPSRKPDLHARSGRQPKGEK
jgi:ribulose-bisphosphate carboxylase small chain